MGGASVKSPATSNEEIIEPKEVITKQAYNESLHVLRGMHEDRPAWHAILVSHEKRRNLRGRRSDNVISVDDFGRNIHYRDTNGMVRQASGYGSEPPETLHRWLQDNYDHCTIDGNASLQYEDDDIRLCTLQRHNSEESFGFVAHYHRHEQFHYIILRNNDRSNLAYRAGLRSFDRVIEYDGINIEADSGENFRQRLARTHIQELQLLVCNPATYLHYRNNQRRLHSHLITVQRLEPASYTDNSSTTATSNDQFRTAQWDNDPGLEIISTATSSHASHLVRLYDTCLIDDDDGRDLQKQSKLDQNHSLMTVLCNSDGQFFVLQNYERLCRQILVAAEDSTFITAYQETLLSSPSTLTAAESQAAQHDLDTHGGGNENQKQLPLASPINDLLKNLENSHVRCQNCGTVRMFNDRYRCLECPNYDICGLCFDQRCETLTHHVHHVMIRFTGPNEIFGEVINDMDMTMTLKTLKEKYTQKINENIQCKSCLMNPIVGLAFKCDLCYDYHLCYVCMEKRVHYRSHPLLVVGQDPLAKITLDDIELYDELGRGGFGTVYVGKWLSKNRVVACKVISVAPEKTHLEKSFRKELAAYAELSGPYILQTYGYNIEKLSTGIERCTLVMEYMHRGSLARVLRQAEQMALRLKLEMACQIASGMRKLHSHRMIHRDIRPDNILITHDYVAKIGDMGLARVWSPDELLTMVGCSPYMPHEFYTGKYDQSLDVFTFGLTLNELFTEKRQKFDPLTRQIELIETSPIFADLINRCIIREPSQRPAALEIEQTLRLYKQTFEKYVRDQRIPYAKMSIGEKNHLFLDLYTTLRPDVDRILRNSSTSR